MKLAEVDVFGTAHYRLNSCLFIDNLSYAEAI